MVDRFLNIIDSMSIWTGKTTSWLTLLAIFASVYEIIARYVFIRPTAWATEVLLFGCAVLYVIGGAWTLQEKKHVRIDFLYEKLGQRKQALFDILMFFFFALYLGLMLWAIGKYAWESLRLQEHTGSPWNPPLYPIKIAFLLGTFLLLAQGIANFVRDVRRFKEK